MSIWLSAIFPTKAGSVAQAVPTTDGLTSYAGTTTTRHQLTCGVNPAHVVIREWRYGPRRLRVDDDDDNPSFHKQFHPITLHVSDNITLSWKCPVLLGYSILLQQRIDATHSPDVAKATAVTVEINKPTQHTSRRFWKGGQLFAFGKKWYAMQRKWNRDKNARSCL